MTKTHIVLGSACILHHSLDLLSIRWDNTIYQISQLHTQPLIVPPLISSLPTDVIDEGGEGVNLRLEYAVDAIQLVEDVGNL